VDEWIRHCVLNTISEWSVLECGSVMSWVPGIVSHKYGMLSLHVSTPESVEIGICPKGMKCRYNQFCSYVLPINLLWWIQIEPIDLQVKSIVPRVAASHVKVKSSSFAIFEVGVDDQ